MKKNLNVIQINGIRGIICACFIVICLLAGFVAFPGIVTMKIWNFIAVNIEQIPMIGVIQGILLWGIIAASYFTFRKNKLVVCMRATDGLNEDELKAVFETIKKQAQNDTFIQSMIKAREAELKIRKLSECEIPKVNISEKNNEAENKIESK